MRSSAIIATVLLAVPALGGCDDDDLLDAESVSFQVSIENVSNPGTLDTDRAMGTVPLSPGVWVVFEGIDPAVAVGELADRGTELIAEDGFPSPELSPPNTSDTEAEIIARLVDTGQVGTFASPGGTPDVPAIFPGESAQFTLTAFPGQRLQIETMFVQSNDWFYAFSDGGLPLFDGDDPVAGDVTDRLVLYDAGTEQDTAPGTGPSQKPVQDAAAIDVGPAESVALQRAVDRHPSFDIPATSAVIRVTITPLS